MTLLQRALALSLQTIQLQNGKQIEFIDSASQPALDKDSQSAKEVAVLLHGIGSGAASWVLQFEAAIKSHQRLLAWNAPGYGNSTTLDAAHPRAMDYGRALWAWLDALKVERVHLVGHSLGCLMAASGAALHPTRVHSLTLLSPAQGYGNALAEIRNKKTNDRLENLAKLGAAGVAKARGAALLRASATEEEKELAIDTMSRIHVGGYTQATLMLSTGDIRTDIRAFQNASTGSAVAPIHVACGADDTITPPNLAKGGARQLAADLAVPYTEIADAGHLVAIENPTAVNDLSLPYAIGGMSQSDRGGLQGIGAGTTPLSAGADISPTAQGQTNTEQITVGELCVRFLESIGARTAFGVISIHNMPILDAFHKRLSETPHAIRFVSARGEAGACNMADAAARVSGRMGVCITSTGTGAGNAAGALIEALTAGTPMLHLTGQIESEYLDRDLGFIHEAPKQVPMLAAAGKAAFRIDSPQTALAVLRKAALLASTAPCGPVSIEMAIDVQKMMLALPTELATPDTIRPEPTQGSAYKLTPSTAPQAASLLALAQALTPTKRPLLWLGGGLRQSTGARQAVMRLVNLGWGVVTSVQGRGILPEDHPATLGAFNLQKAAQDLYAKSDAMLVVGSRLRSNETLSYKLQLPQKLYRIDANPAANDPAKPHPYAFVQFVLGDAALTLNALADSLEAAKSKGTHLVDADWQSTVEAARHAADGQVNGGLAAYTALKAAVQKACSTQLAGNFNWVRDITLSNTMWGNRAPALLEQHQGVHALGGGIGQGLAMGIGAAVASHRKTLALCGDGGFMLNVGELACAVQERVNLLVILMNDSCYGVIKNIQDADYGSRHCYVDLHTPDIGMLCASMKAHHVRSSDPALIDAQLVEALAFDTPTVLEIDMKAWGSFAVKFAGPPRK
jgi:acetolactate synthase I/II/III large subunit